MTMQAQVGEVWARGQAPFGLVFKEVPQPTLETESSVTISFLSRPSLEVDRGGGSGQGPSLP